MSTIGKYNDLNYYNNIVAMVGKLSIQVIITKLADSKGYYPTLMYF